MQVAFLMMYVGHACMGDLYLKALDTYWWRWVPYLKVLGSIPGQGETKIYIVKDP